MVGFKLVHKKLLLSSALTKLDTVIINTSPLALEVEDLKYCIVQARRRTYLKTSAMLRLPNH